MGIAEAIATAVALTNAGLDLLNKSGAISALIAKAQSEGRTTLTDDEWKAVIGLDDDAKKKLANAIEAMS